VALINIKGFKDSLVFIFEPGTFEEYIEFLQTNLSQNNRLLTGFKVTFKGDGLKKLSLEQMSQIQALCLEHGLVLNNIVTDTNIPPKNIIIYKNVRSGQKIYSDGSVIIWGDVHESAEIAAVQDIIVLGKLAGIAHAGCKGNKNSIVFALSLSPTQIRIAGHISRSPGNCIINDYPEIAFLEDNSICIKEYSPRDTKARFNII